MQFIPRSFAVFSLALLVAGYIPVAEAKGGHHGGHGGGHRGGGGRCNGQNGNNQQQGSGSPYVNQAADTSNYGRGAESQGTNASGGGSMSQGAGGHGNHPH